MKDPIVHMKWNKNIFHTLEIYALLNVKPIYHNPQYRRIFCRHDRFIY